MKLELWITSFPNGNHVYGTLMNSRSLERVAIKRPICRTEIDSDLDRFYNLNEGDMVEYHNSVKDLLLATEQYAVLNKIAPADIVVFGLRNYKEWTLDKMLNLSSIDHSIYCTICLNKITGGFYNHPSGVQCISCSTKRKGV